MQERRQGVRWPINRMVRYKTIEDEDFHQCGSLDLSLRGIKIQLSEELSCDMPINLEIWLNDQIKILATSKVVWQSELESPGYFDAGLNFINIKDQDKEKIFEYMIANSPQEVIQHWWEGLK